MNITFFRERFALGKKMAYLFIFVISYIFYGIALAADGDPFNFTLYPVPGTEIEIQIAIDKPTYAPGESVIIFGDKTLRNCLDCSVSINTEFSYQFGSNPLVIYADDDSFSNSYVDVITAPMTPGNYSLRVRARSYGNYLGSPFADWNEGFVTFTVGTPPSGTINVTSNDSSATWTITGPSGVLPPGSGTSASYTNQPVGSYTITWDPISGRNTPSTDSLYLGAGETRSFFGNYVVSTACTVQTSINGSVTTYNQGDVDFDDFWVAFNNSNTQFTGSGFAGALRYRACGAGGTGCGSPFGVWSAATATRRPTIPATCSSFANQCSNGIDDDSDGQIDTSDPQCHSDGNAGNPASYTPTVNAEGAAPSVNLNFI